MTVPNLLKDSNGNHILSSFSLQKPVYATMRSNWQGFKEKAWQDEKHPAHNNSESASYCSKKKSPGKLKQLSTRFKTCLALCNTQLRKSLLGSPVDST